MEKEDWIKRLAENLGFLDGLPSDLIEKAETLKEYGYTVYGASQWLRRYLNA